MEPAIIKYDKCIFSYYKQGIGSSNLIDNIFGVLITKFPSTSTYQAAIWIHSANIPELYSTPIFAHTSTSDLYTKILERINFSEIQYDIIAKYYKKANYEIKELINKRYETELLFF